MFDELFTVNSKKNQLDCYRPLNTALANNLRDWFRVELTYTSNAIEGNTLTRAETALVVEKAQLGGSLDDYHQLIITAVDRSLDIYLEAVTAAD